MQVVVRLAACSQRVQLVGDRSAAEQVLQEDSSSAANTNFVFFVHNPRDADSTQGFYLKVAVCGAVSQFSCAGTDLMTCFYLSPIMLFATNPASVHLI